MSPILLVITDVITDQAAKVLLIQRDNTIQDLAAAPGYKGATPCVTDPTTLLALRSIITVREPRSLRHSH